MFSCYILKCNGYAIKEKKEKKKKNNNNKNNRKIIFNKIFLASFKIREKCYIKEMREIKKKENLNDSYNIYHL